VSGREDAGGRGGVTCANRLAPICPTCGPAVAGLIPGSDRGVSLRFPRFLRDRTGEKGPEDATTVGEVAELFGAQARR
jgi:hypothetical protein